MRVQVITCVHQTGVGKASKRAYDFYSVGALVQTGRGTQYAEFMLDGEQPAPVAGKSYDVSVEAYPDREKKLVIRIASLREAEAPKLAASGAVK